MRNRRNGRIERIPEVFEIQNINNDNVFSVNDCEQLDISTERVNLFYQ